MWKRLTAAVLALMMIPALALAARPYLVTDSDTRALTESELWGWDYESLGYILNEVFARHGCNFIAGGKYDNFFRDRPWYKPNKNADNSVACYPKLGSLEWANLRLIRQVREAMRAQHTINPGGKNYLSKITLDGQSVLSGFPSMALKSGQQLAFYAAPGTDAYRGADGQQTVSTNAPVYVAGWDGTWLLMMVKTDRGAVRVGNVDGETVKGKLKARTLAFAHQAATLTQDANLTDDPSTTFATLRALPSGETVTYLTTYHNAREWAYVETTVDGKAARGFIPAEALAFSDALAENETVTE